MGDGRLLTIGITSGMVDGAEHLVGIELVHECTGAIVNGFPANQHIVGIHHAVNEAQ